MGGALEHWQYDTFVTRFDDKTIEPAYVTFALDADGKVERITMKAGVADRRFQLRLSGPAVHPGPRRHWTAPPRPGGARSCAAARRLGPLPALGAAATLL